MTSEFPPDMRASSAFTTLLETGAGFVMTGGSTSLLTGGSASLLTGGSASPVDETTVSIIVEDQIVLGDIVILYWDYSGVMNERGS